jgi:hypothetical protein
MPGNYKLRMGEFIHEPLYRSGPFCKIGVSKIAKAIAFRTFYQAAPVPVPASRGICKKYH